eukprot:scaffold15909_cov128-Isochrysis_galbana.AAC.5
MEGIAHSPIRRKTTVTPLQAAEKTRLLNKYGNLTSTELNPARLAEVAGLLQDRAKDWNTSVVRGLRPAHQGTVPVVRAVRDLTDTYVTRRE